MNLSLLIAGNLPKDWKDMSDSEKRLATALIAYVAGDAFGAFYEFTERTSEIPNVLRKKLDWPFGSTSDDTSLTLLTLLSLRARNVEESAKDFLTLIRQNQSQLRGLGPTTRAALDLPVKDFEVNSIGLTNGAMMRTALLGLIFTERDERQKWVRILSASTHREYGVDAAVALADIFAGLVHRKGTVDPKDFKSGVSNDANTTLDAVVYVAGCSSSVSEAIRLACSLGGDTDTVAALSAALVASRNWNSTELLTIPWLNDVDWTALELMSPALESAFARL